MAARIAHHQGFRTIAVDLVPERLKRAQDRGIETLDVSDHGDDLEDAIRDMTDGRGPDSVIDAVGMEAHGSPGAKLLQTITGVLPDVLAAPLNKTAGVDRLSALYSAIDIVRRGGTVSSSGSTPGLQTRHLGSPCSIKQIQFRMGQANVLRWVDDILPLLTDEDSLGVDKFATHHLSLEDAPHGYKIFQKKEDGAVKIVLRP